LILSFASFTNINAQESKSCYIDYLAMFNTRTAKPVTDGVQNVIVTVRNSDGTKCQSNVGTIEVKNGELVGRLMLKTKSGDMVSSRKGLDDGLSEKYQAEKKPIKLDFKITNGMSASFLTQKKFIVNLFFIDFLNPPTPVLEEAPSVKH